MVTSTEFDKNDEFEAKKEKLYSEVKNTEDKIEVVEERLTEVKSLLKDDEEGQRLKKLIDERIEKHLKKEKERKYESDKSQEENKSDEKKSENKQEKVEFKEEIKNTESTEAKQPNQTSEVRNENEGEDKED